MMAVRLHTVGWLAATVGLVVCSAGALGGVGDERTVVAGGYRLHYVARPELGYVVKSHAPGAHADGARVLRVARRSRNEAVVVVYEHRPAAEASKAIDAIRGDRRVGYAAPLYCVDTEVVAILPEVVVRLRSDSDAQHLRTLCAGLGLTFGGAMAFTNREYLLEVPGRDANEVLAAAERLNEASFVEWAVANTVSSPRRRGPPGNLETLSAGAYRPDGAAYRSNDAAGPNDLYFPLQWHLHNTGQSGGTPDADINALQAWEVTAGDPNVVVAVQDMGMDLDHPDLAGNLVQGYDFLEDDTEPYPEVDAGFVEGHGTACAGLVGAAGNNGIGVAGVAWRCSVMPVRVMTWNQAVSEADMAEAIRWSAVAGADVMSYSWGYTTPRPMIHSAIADIVRPGGIGRQGKGCVVFVAAGNSGGPIPQDDTAAYPEVIAVGATDHNDRRCWYSANGPALDLAAPGGGGIVVDNLAQPYHLERFMTLSTDLLWTTDIMGDMGFSLYNADPWMTDYTDRMWGTSAATPIAAGVAALVLSVDPSFTAAQVRQIVLESARDLGEPGWDPYYGHGRVDAAAAVETAVRRLLAGRADIDGSGRVDWMDFTLLAAQWGRDDCGPDNSNCNGADVAPDVRDGVVGGLDLAALADGWLAGGACR